ncbi:MAG: hypothetical protein ACXAE3_10565 [Candidatus Kariarchaeaceae archaeon]|jgi:hypothetical protein
MSYTIKTYQEGFIEDQFRIGSAIYDPWPMGGQTRPDQLRAAYQGENFDPETRFYAFDGEIMVGFLTSSFNEEREGKRVYFFEPPYVLPDHAPEAETQLINHAFAKLKEKGADILQTRAGEYWGKSLHYATMYGFEWKSDIVRRGEITLGNADATSFGDPQKFVEYDHELHKNALIDLLAEKYGAPRENIEAQAARWEGLQPGTEIKSPWDHTLTIMTHRVVMAGKKVVGRVLIMNHSNFGETTINLSNVVLREGYESLLGDALATLVSVGQSQAKALAVVHSGLWGSFQSDKPFEKYGIDLEMKLGYYEKNI